MSDMAVKYGMLKRAKKMADGGDMCAHGKYMCHECHGGEYAKGGSVPGADRDIKGVHKPINEDAPGQSGAGFMNDLMRDAKSRGRDDIKQEAKRHVKAHHERVLDEMKSMKKPNLYAEGGVVEEDDRMLNQHGAEEVGAMDTEEDNEPQHERMVSHPVENQDDHEDMVGRIMRQRTHHYSRGGQVANDTPVTADFEDNQFDDLVKRDDLEQHYTGANSGDEIGDGQEDEDRHDIVSRIMRSRRKRDHLPHPA